MVSATGITDVILLRALIVGAGNNVHGLVALSSKKRELEMTGVRIPAGERGMALSRIIVDCNDTAEWYGIDEWLCVSC